MTQRDPLRGLCAYLLWLGSSADDCLGPARRTLDLLVALVDDSAARHGTAGSAAAGTAGRADPTAQGLVEPAATPGRGDPTRRDVRCVARLPQPDVPGRVRPQCRRRHRAGTLRARAEALLVRTDLPAQAIAVQCGYADLSHFSHRFTAIHGLPPTAYRRHGGAVPSVLDHAGVRRLDRLLRAGTTAWL